MKTNLTLKHFPISKKNIAIISAAMISIIPGAVFADTEPTLFDFSTPEVSEGVQPDANQDALNETSNETPNENAKETPSPTVLKDKPMTPIPATPVEAAKTLPWAIKEFSATTPLIAHAMGEVDGYTLTNSKTALEQAYAKGYRVFEMDFEFTSDGFLVGVHDWGNYAKFTGWTKENYGAFVIPDHKTFMETKLNGYMEPLDLETMLKFMADHPDVWLITDTKATDLGTIKRQFGQIVETALFTEGSVLDRVVPQVYSKEMYQSIHSIHAFPSYIYTLYATATTDDAVVKVVKETGIRTVTMPGSRVRKSLVNRLNKISTYVCAHTINDTQEVARLKTLGVRGIYTDKLMPY